MKQGGIKFSGQARSTFGWAVAESVYRRLYEDGLITEVQLASLLEDDTEERLFAHGWDDTPGAPLLETREGPDVF